MSTETLFLNTLINAYPDDAPDPFFARWMHSFSKQIRYNVKLRKITTIALDAGGNYLFTPTNIALADWSVIIIRVIGAARIDTVGKDTDGTTTIDGSTPTYGTSIYPGYVLFSTYNSTFFNLVGQQNGSVIELFHAISEEDS